MNEQKTLAQALTESLMARVPQINLSHSVKKRSKRSENDASKDFDSNSIINVEYIKGGLVKCKDGSYVKILEVIPLNYYQKEISEKNKITESFMLMFRTCPSDLHIKLRTEKADVNNIIRLIRNNCASENNELLTQRAEEYIEQIRLLQNDNTITTKFYVMFAYEGENGKFSRDFNDIYMSMKRTEMDIRSKLMSCGNLVVTPDNEDYHACEVLYKFYNPISCSTETLDDRIDRMVSDYTAFGKEAKEADFIAPRGLSSRPLKDYIMMDGMYHTYLVLREHTYPKSVQTGWLDNIPNYLGVDRDIFISRYNREMVTSTISQMRKVKYAVINNNRTNIEKAESAAREAQNMEYIRQVIGANDEDLFKVEVFITIRSESLREMMDRRDQIQKNLEGYSIETSTSFLTAHEWLKCAAPDMYNNRSLYSKFSHNMLTRNLAQIYPFTSMSLFSDEGFVIGRNVIGDSLVSFNNFDTSLYSNSNMVVLGTSGSGKTYLELMLSYRMRMMGIRTMFVLPLKAHEYYGACMNMGGQFIRFIPGGKARVNIMEIRPQLSADGKLLEDDEMGIDTPLLARKIASLSAWLQLNMLGDTLTVREKSRFQTLCTELYANFGITADNDSIWLDKEKGKLKVMPILKDLNDALREDPELDRVKDVLAPYMKGGIFSNFNGYTNVDLSNPFLVFDVDKTSIGEDYLPAMMYLAFDCCYDLAKQSLVHKDAIFMDECWIMLGNKECAAQLKEAVKILRGYSACAILGTQDISDFIRSSNGFGESILASSKIKFLLRMEDLELNHVSEILDINAKDKANFRKFPPHGRAMMMSDNDKILIDLFASESETRAFTTDGNLKKKYLEESKQI